MPVFLFTCDSGTAIFIESHCMFCAGDRICDFLPDEDRDYDGTVAEILIPVDPAVLNRWMPSVEAEFIIAKLEGSVQ